MIYVALYLYLVGGIAIIIVNYGEEGAVDNIFLAVLWPVVLPIAVIYYLWGGK